MNCYGEMQDRDRAQLAGMWAQEKVDEVQVEILL